MALAIGAMTSAPGQIPERDTRNTEIRHTDLHYSLPEYTREQWERRAAFLRRQILFSAGLLPLPSKSPLNPLVGDLIVHDDYSVESVLLETFPGFFLGGNLYRPVGRDGKLPAVVSPHGHWRFGRFENSEVGSVPGRAINLARQGYIVFAYDMVGWNDTMQVPHGFAGPREELWLIGTLGLQLWNSIRVVDYLASLPDVDPNRIGATGASGGGTQTFLLAAIDDRIGYSAPVNMVSFIMQGGSRCENAALLRVGTNNVEIAALFAPKPQLLVAATGDWTVNTPNEEFPAVRSVYSLLDATSNIEYEQFDSPHNYHEDSREAVYRFFGKHILSDADASKFKERSVRPDQLSQLLYLWGREPPESAIGFEEFMRQRIAAAEADTLALSVHGQAALERAREAFKERLGLALLAEVPDADRLTSQSDSDGLVLGRKEVGDRIPAKYLNSYSSTARPTLFVHAEGISAGNRSEALHDLVGKKVPVLLIDVFQTGGAMTERDIAGAGRNAERYYHVFNRSDDANRVQDILTAAAHLRQRSGSDAVNLVGVGKAGLWALLAAALDPGIQSVIADLDQFDATDDSAYVADLFIPGLRRAGDFRAVAALTSDRSLLLHNAHAAFPSRAFRAAFDADGNSDNLLIQGDPADKEGLVGWLTR